MLDSKPLAKKPLLRGYIHQEAFFVALGACALLIAKSTSPRSLAASAIYSFGLLFLFGASALYHRPFWKPKERAFMKRLDHSAIFILIAGTFTPICMIALSEKSGSLLLKVAWIVASFGVAQSIFWVSAPKWFTALAYVAMGWLPLSCLSELVDTLGVNNVLLLAAG